MDDRIFRVLAVVLLFKETENFELRVWQHPANSFANEMNIIPGPTPGASDPCRFMQIWKDLLEQAPLESVSRVNIQRKSGERLVKS